MKPGPRQKRQTRSARVPTWIVDEATEIAERENISTAEAFEHLWGETKRDDADTSVRVPATPSQPLDTAEADRAPQLGRRLDVIERQQRGLAAGMAGLMAGQRVLARRGGEDEWEAALRDELPRAMERAGLKEGHATRVLAAWDDDDQTEDEDMAALENPQNNEADTEEQDKGEARGLIASLFDR